MMCLVPIVVPSVADARHASKPRPDLRAASIAVTGANAPGGRLSVTSVIRASKAPAKASRTIFLLSRDAARSRGDLQLGSVATPRIKAGAGVKSSARIRLPLGFTGSFYILACADGAGAIGETSEKNNCKASTRRTMAASGGSTTAPGTGTNGANPVQGPTTITNGEGAPPAPSAPPLPVLDMGVTRGAIEGDVGSAHALEYDVALSAPAAQAVTFAWTTSSIGTAQAGDFIASSGTGTIPAGQRLTTVFVPIVGDTVREDDESVRVVIATPSGATIGNSRADAMIFDDEIATVSASAASQTSVELTWSAAPTNLLADGSQFTITGLSVTAASAVGKVVTLTTSAQLANQEYTVDLAPDLRANARTVASSSNFLGTGPIAHLEITEVNANISGNADLVELHAVSGGSLVGAAVDPFAYTGGGAAAYLPSIAVAQGDIVLLHYGSPGFTSETQNRTQCVLTKCSGDAWDVAENTQLPVTPTVLTFVDGSAIVTDGVPFRQASITSSDATLRENLDGLQDHGLWTFCALGVHCADGAAYDTVAVDWSGTGTTATGQSMRRIGGDTNQASDWALGMPSWGAANS
jgi:hypothetical protein